MRGGIPRRLAQAPMQVQLVLRLGGLVADEGLRAIGIDPNAGDVREGVEQSAGAIARRNAERRAAAEDAEPAQGAPTPAPRGKLRDAAAAVLAMLRRAEGATLAQICEATGWQQRTVRGFFAGLKKRQGIEVQVLERVRRVGPNKEGAKGSFTIYRIAK